MRKLVVAASPVLAWPAASNAAPPLPPVLQPYVHDGRYEPGDYGWMRGSFADASETDKAAFESVMSWVNECFARDREQVRSELRAMGVESLAMEQLTPARDPLCIKVSYLPWPQKASYAELQRDAIEATPYAASYLFALRNLLRMTGGGGSFADQLKSRVIPDQLVRIRWGEGDWADAPRLSPGAKTIVDAQIGAAMAEVDRANTEWLKAMVAQHGWPTISRDGKEAAANAWLLVQHADADPAFQLKALRLMEPLVAKDEVEKQNYALLYDRTMLKITGKQRYGTQVTCAAGKRVPQPLEDEAQLASRRASMNLQPIGDYLKLMDEHLGSCPPGG